MLKIQKNKVIYLDLPVRDLSSSEMLQIFSSFAEFERSPIKERTQEGLAKIELQ
ncbi:MAG: recombinase family protein [Oleiphilus sp.]